jgi:hypothetical protein
MTNKLTSTKIRNLQKRWRQGRVEWSKFSELLTRYKNELKAVNPPAQQQA